MSREPKILFVASHSIGEQTGYGLRIANTLAGLSAVGDVKTLFLARSDGDPVWAGKDDVTTIRTCPERVPAGYFRAIKTTHPREAGFPDLHNLRQEIITEMGKQWDLVWTFRARSFTAIDGLVEPKRIVVDFDDLYDLHYRSLVKEAPPQPDKLRQVAWPLAWRLDAFMWARYQRHVANRCQRVVVVSPEDRQHLSDISNSSVIPNGYRSYPATAYNQDRPIRMLFIGGLHYGPNAGAAQKLTEEVLPYVRQHDPAAEVLLVGRKAPSTSHLANLPGVVAPGHVADLDPWFKKASVVVTCIGSGGGSRLKVIEAMSRQLPLVSTSLGVRGFNLTHNHDVLVANTAHDIAAAVVNITNDSRLRQKLIRNAHQLFLDNYSSDCVQKRTADVACQVLNEAEDRKGQ